MKHTDYEIQKLVKARARIERRLRDLDLKIDHVLFRMDEERCFSRKCPMDDGDELVDLLFPDQKPSQREYHVVGRKRRRP
jgi:hypothetical protein